MKKLRVFLESEMATECDACGRRFDIVKGGVCERCRRILCARDLHGSFVQRLLADLRGRAICVACRREGPAASP
ncbi:MAG: hypothetical protein ACYC4J_11855 [Gemmatimonadaceae bacterium]